MDKCYVKYNWEMGRKERENEKKKKLKEENDLANVTLATDDDRPFSAHKNNSKQKEKKICAENVEKSKEENSQVTLAADDVAQLSAHKKKVRFSDVKAYEWPNKRDIIKEPNDDSFEIKFNFMKKELVKETEKFIRENCDKKGNPKNRNMTRRQEKGIKELGKRAEVEMLKTK